MAYQERGSGLPHFNGKNYQMWQRRVAAFIHDKGQILWDVTMNIAYVHLVNFLALGSRDMCDANNKAVNYPIPCSVSIRIGSGLDRGLGV
jgi:hypothetical protein